MRFLGMERLLWVPHSQFNPRRTGLCNISAFGSSLFRSGMGMNPFIFQSENPCISYILEAFPQNCHVGMEWTKIAAEAKTTPYLGDNLLQMSELAD
jgi:hypothetical protein